MYFYATPQTEEFLQSSAKRVYLYGGYEGYNNFGDIIQLKNAVQFHRQQTGLSPVIIIALSSVEDGAYVERLKAWFECDYFIFIDSNPYDVADAGLVMLKQIQAGGFLHVYGGGYLNRFWGKNRLAVIRQVLQNFKVKNYALTGLQIDPEIVGDLAVLFSKYPPLLVGLRDRMSLKHTKGITPKVQCAYSFDDVTEVFLSWREANKRRLRAQLRSKVAGSHFLLHMNMTSEYIDSDSQRIKMTEYIHQTHDKYPRHGLVVAQAYNDRRLLVRDGLASVIELENDLPFHHYRVLNIAQMSLDMRLADGYFPDIAGLLSSVRFAISSSYHTAMLMNFFGVPAFLVASNEYYEQKQKGLGYVGDFKRFLADPSINLKRFERDLEERRGWIGRLKETFASAKDGQRSKLVRLAPQALTPTEPIYYKKH